MSSPAASGSPTVGDTTVVVEVETGSTASNAAQQTELSHTESAQSRVLRTYELLDLIISFMVDLSLGLRLPLAPPDSVDILRVSLTSRAFFHPAMNALWRCMDSWSAVLRLIPNLVQDGEIYTTRDLILEEHFERLCSYTRRVRHFSFSKCNDRVAPHIYAALTHFREKQLFPGLLTLSIPDFSVVFDKNPPFSLFLSPTLTEISIHGVFPPSAEINAASLLHMASLCCPKIKNVDWGGDFSDATLNAILGFSALEKLEISSEKAEMSGMIFHKLSQIRGLKSLSICLGKAITADKFVHSPETVTFPSLETLQLRGPSNAIFYVLNNMALSTLSSLGLNFTSTPRGDRSPEKCLVLIQTKGAIKTLQSIRVAGETLRSVADSDDVLNHLVTYGPQLANIDVEVYSACREDLPDMCDCVFSPNLKSFKYASVAADDDLNGQPRLSDLQVVPGKMINVRVLHVPVSLNMDEEAIELLQNAVKGERKCHGLEEIILRPLVSDLRNYAAPAVVYPPKKFTALTALTVGKYLNYLFPHLKSVDMSRFSQIDEAWRKAVEDVVMTLQRERKHIDDRGLCCKTCTNFPGQLRV